MNPGLVAVVGGGAAGMMAAGRAAEYGAQVVLFEKMDHPGKKLSITGNGRSNVTNSRELDQFVSMYGANGRFLYRAFTTFFRDDLLDFLRSYGIETITESDGRIFPASESARDIIKALEKYMASGTVTIRTHAAVSDILFNSGCVTGLDINGELFLADGVVLATGGSSYPGTGSTGDGYGMAARVGHTIVPVRPALVPLKILENNIVQNLQGLSLKDVRLSAYRCSAEQIDTDWLVVTDYGRGFPKKPPNRMLVESRRGDLIFTHFGIGGPVVLQASLAVVDALKNSPVSISIDLKPEIPLSEVESYLQSQFDVLGKRNLKSILKEIIPERLAEVIVEMAQVQEEGKAARIDARERRRIALTMKSFKLNVSGAMPMAEAMVTAGGISLDEIDPKTMGSKLIPGLYFCGEVMDIDADTGGYNLQAAFSTGYLAGQSAAELVLSRVKKPV